ncbi:MAG TPA: CsiV family protein, partial [Xanthomonadaceae bacterium]|nr:CsiV family protein [Xanthomonadaceae bacterium]
MNRLRLVALCLALLLPLSLPAENARPQLYQVELILFRQLDAVAEDAWPSAHRSRAPRSARTLMRFDDEDTPPVDFFRVEDRRLRLARAWQRMQGLGEVEPLLLMGWRQSHGLLRVGRRVRLDDETDGLSGFLALRLGNRLVAEVDVSLDAAPAEPDPPPFRPFGDPEPLPDWRVE